MRQFWTRKRVYTFLGLAALIYTLVGVLFISSFTYDCFGPPCPYDIRNDSMALFVIFLVTGVPLFLLFLFLERRASKDGS